MQYLQIVDWDIHQTYRKDRGTPPWIKVHRTLFSSQRWSGLTDAEKGQLVSIWLLGADKKGIIPADPNTLRKICILDNPPNLPKFIDLGYLVSNGVPNDNQMATTCQPSDSPETETETETETEDPIVRKEDFAPQRLKFEKIWENYPAKKGKEKAWIKFKNQVKTDQDFEDIQKALKNYIADVEHIQGTKQPDLQFQNGSTWFHQNWKDYINFKPVPRGGTNMQQAQLSRGEFVDKVLLLAEKTINESSCLTKLEAVNALIDKTPEEDKKAVSLILYNYSYTEKRP